MQLPRNRERSLYALVAGGALAVIYVVAFIVANASAVKVSFVLFDASISLVVVMALCGILGAVIGIAGGRAYDRRRHARPAESAKAGSPPPS